MDYLVKMLNIKGCIALERKRSEQIRHGLNKPGEIVTITLAFVF
jgi:hypothetical protein